MSLRIQDQRLVLVFDSAVPVPPPRAAEGRPSAMGAGHTWPADGAPTGSAAGPRFGQPRNPAPPASSTAGGAALPRAMALSGSERPPQSPFFAAADGVSRASDAPASPPERGGGSGGDVTSFDSHVDRALDVGGFGPVVDPLGPRLVKPAPVADPALRDPERVWIAARRKGIDRHFVLSGFSLGAGVFTYCSRSIRTGELLPADDPWVVEHTKPCQLCWPRDGA